MFCIPYPASSGGKGIRGKKGGKGGKRRGCTKNPLYNIVMKRRKGTSRGKGKGQEGGRGKRRKETSSYTSIGREEEAWERGGNGEERKGEMLPYIGQKKRERGRGKRKKGRKR